MLLAMKRACVLVLVAATSYAGSGTQSPLPETTRGAPIGVACRWNDEAGAKAVAEWH